MLLTLRIENVVRICSTHRECDTYGKNYFRSNRHISAVHKRRCIASNDRTKASYEWYGMWKEAVIARDYSRAAEEIHKTPRQIGSVVSEVRTGHIPNISQQRGGLQVK
jgi:hypothetical protein